MTGHEATHKAHHRVRVGLDGVLALEGHADPREDEEGPEEVDDPVELVDEIGAGRDHRAAHDERAEDPPEQDAVLVAGRDAEVAEDEDEDEDVVDAQRLLDQVARQVLEPRLRPHEDVDAHAEEQRERHPHDAPARGLPEGDLVRLAVEDPRSTASMATTNRLKPAQIQNWSIGSLR